VASVRRCQKLLPCWVEPALASSNMDLLLAKATPISSAGSTSVITGSRSGGGKTVAAQQQLRERSENM